jgi:hypothetical protein
MQELAITQGTTILSYARNAKDIKLPNGKTVWGPLHLAALPLTAGEYTIRRVVVTGEAPTQGKLGGFKPGVVSGDIVVIERTVTPLSEDLQKAQLESRKAAALLELDQMAENARSRWVTLPGPIQGQVYARKAAQAAECLAKSTAKKPPKSGQYPALDAEVGITADTLIGVAKAILDKNALSNVAFDQIETTRLTMKQRLRQAGSLEEIDALMQSIVWAKPD